MVFELRGSGEHARQRLKVRDGEEGKKTERWVCLTLSFTRSVSLFVCLSVHPSVCLCVCMSLFPVVVGFGVREPECLN